jgi:hypothetical protein
MRRVWKHILPHGANSSDIKEESVTKGITDIVKDLGFDGLENADVQELLNPHLEELTDDDLLLGDRAFEDSNNDAEE